ncbi:hypothetical protein EMMF5_001800 [Cystobasidiomycetes sp. EMM_F5]
MRVLGSLLLASTLLLFSVSAAQDANPQPRMLRYANHEIRQATRATVLENKLRRDEDEDARMSRRQESRLYPRQSSCMCPPGAQGPPGPQGPDGIPGPQGQQGLQEVALCGKQTSLRSPSKTFIGVFLTYFINADTASLQSESTLFGLE